MQPTTLPLVPEASWTVQEVAKELRVSETTVRREIEQGAFPRAYRVRRKLIRIPKADVDAYQRRKRILAPHPEDHAPWPLADQQAGGAA